jgi:hypothetical protein
MIFSVILFWNFQFGWFLWLIIVPNSLGNDQKNSYTNPSYWILLYKLRITNFYQVLFFYCIYIYTNPINQAVPSGKLT